MKTDSVTAKDRHVINSSPLVDTKYENIWGVFGQCSQPLIARIGGGVYGQIPSVTKKGSKGRSRMMTLSLVYTIHKYKGPW